MKQTEISGPGKEASAGAGPGTEEQGQLQSSPELQQQRAVLTSLAVDPGTHHAPPQLHQTANPLMHGRLRNSPHASCTMHRATTQLQ